MFFGLNMFYGLYKRFILFSLAANLERWSEVRGIPVKLVSG